MCCFYGKSFCFGDCGVMVISNVCIKLNVENLRPKFSEYTFPLKYAFLR